MQKQVVVPLVLLFLPSATTVLFFLQFSITLYLQGRLALSSPQPAWVHFYLTHQRLFARLWLAGMGCSLLNAALTTCYFAGREKSTATGLTGMGIMTPLLAAVVISLPLSHGGGLISLTENYLFPKILRILSVEVIMVLMGSATLLIFLCALRCLNELWNRRGHPAPPPVPVVLAAENSDRA